MQNLAVKTNIVSIIPSSHVSQSTSTSKKLKMTKIISGIPIKKYPDILRGSFYMKNEQNGYETASVAPKII